jgi:MinD superfamily P-loop ATPase
MREIVVISGKGGTGKTSLTACFALLAEGTAVLADCDVDAADLHLILTPKTKEKRDFWSGREASIREKDCTGCGACLNICRFAAIKEKPGLFGRPDLLYRQRFVRRLLRLRAPFVRAWRSFHGTRLCGGLDDL